MQPLRSLSPLKSVKPRPRPALPKPPEHSAESPSTACWTVWPLIPVVVVGGMAVTQAAASMSQTVTYTPPLGPEHHWHPPMEESERTTEVVTRQESSLRLSLETGQAELFPNSEGDSLPVSLSRDGEGYRYRIGQESDVSMRLAPEYRQQGPEVEIQALARAIDYHTQVPAQFRGVVRQVVIEHRDPNSNTDAQYNSGHRRITFFGLGCLDETNFTHEVGHGIGKQVESEDDSWLEWLLGGAEAYLLPHRSPLAPDNWSKITRQEAPPSAYSRENPDEDFAEFWCAYHEARESAGDALEQLRQLYPARYQALQQILEARGVR